MRELSRREIQHIVNIALAEDIGTGDVTTAATIPEQATGRAHMVAREPLVVAGLAVAEAAFRRLSPVIEIKQHVIDGKQVAAGKVLMSVTGATRTILSAERVALNFVQRLSGIATLTRKFVSLVKGTKSKILDTRKTTPGLRILEKYAVSCGGGKNHRSGLFDMILIKDNHLAALRSELPNPIAVAVQQARSRFPKLKVEVEADTLQQVELAVAARADVILLDNMSLKDLRTAVKMVRGRAETEASGGVNLRTVRAIAQTGVDFISVGALTHSACAVDIALDFES